MEKEHAAKIETADIPAELKLTLTDLERSVDGLALVLPAGPGRRIRYLFGRLVTEATDAQTTLAAQRVTLQQALFDYQIALARLREAGGE